MTAVAIDTHAAIKKLQAAGFTEQQAETQIAVLSDVIGSETATRQDLKNTEDALRQDVTKLDAALRQEMAKLESKIAVLEERFTGRFNLLSWMLGFNLAISVAVLWKLIH